MEPRAFVFSQLRAGREGAEVERVQLPRRNNGILILAWKTAKDKEWLSSGWLEDEKKKKKKKSRVEKYFDVGTKGKKKIDNLASDRLAM